MKRIVKRIFKWIGLALLAFLIYLALKALLWGRFSFQTAQLPPRVELSWEQAMQDGVITPEEIAVHYAPEINAAVNVLLSCSGKGDFLTAVDYDGDWVSLNNWENMPDHPLPATVYYSVQETDTHYFAGYYFYHPRDDAETWLDRHENDFEGILLAIPKAEDAFLPPEIMYTQGHGYVPFYFNEDWQMTDGSRHGGALSLDGDRAIIYIAPNGTLKKAGHSVESDAGHTRYWSVGNSGVRYYHGGEAQQPRTFKGEYTRNRCSYALVSLDVLWEHRNGPYGDQAVFASYGAFRGDNFGTNSANPPWGWRNKTIYGYGGSFISDPVWTFNRAIEDVSLSHAYTSNPYADWLITVDSVSVPAGVSEFTLRLSCDSWTLSDPAWWTFTPLEEGLWAVSIADEGRNSLWCAAHAGARWKLDVRRPDGALIPGASVSWSAEQLD